VGAGDSTGGRKPELLAFNPRRFFSMGIRLAAGEASGCLADLDGRILLRVSLRRRVERAGRGSAAMCVREICDRLLAEAAREASAGRLLGVGIALADDVAGESEDTGALREQLGRAARREPGGEPGTPVLIEDEAHVGALGEKWAGRGDSEDFLFVSVGPRIGASLVVGGRLLGGDKTGVGRLGHMRLLAGGPVCRCGLTGCVETLAGDEALARYYREERAAAGADAGAGSIRSIAALAHRGDPAALRAVERAASVLGTAIANVVKLMGIEQVVVAGDTAVLGGAVYLDAVRRQAKAELPPGVRERTVVRHSRLGGDVWLAGAAALVIEEVFRPPIYSSASAVAARVVAQ